MRSKDGLIKLLTRLLSVWLVVAFWSILLYCVFYLRWIEYVHQNLILDLKTNLSAFAIKRQWAMYLKLVFWLNSNSWAYLQGLGSQFLFCPFKDFEWSWLRLTVFVVIHWKVENKELLPTKSFGLNCKAFSKSFM